jgi:hypothetical protein
MFMMVAILGGVGTLFGIETGSTWMCEGAGAIFYGLTGAVVAVPIAFAVNMTRNWR